MNGEAARRTAFEPAPDRPRSARAGGWRERLSELMTNQTRLWDRTLDDLRPWEQEGPLRWRGTRLSGSIVDVDDLVAGERQAHQ
jgi:hypothetical protein